jgi:3-oxoacyl-[acyl-carrier-protein] synthase II
LGVICPLGNSPEALWNALDQGACGVRALAEPSAAGLPLSFAGEAREFTGHIDDFGALEGEQKKALRKGLKTICREAQMGIAAAQRAMLDSGLTQGRFDPERVGVVFGSDYMVSLPEDFAVAVRKCATDGGTFDFTRWAAEGLPQMNPLWLLKYLPNMPAAHLAIYNELRGPNNSLTLREASSNAAVGEALRIVQRGHADIMVAGATGNWIHPTKTVQALLQQELANGGIEAERACRPFDRDRSGAVLGEGAGAVVLEEWEHARARGVTVYAEIAGAGGSTVLDRSRIARRDVALANAVRAALRDAGAAPGDVGHVQAHGLSTTSGDVAEARAIREALGAAADAVPVTAAKSYFGNLGAGSGAVELIAGVLALRAGRLFSIRNYETPDPECPVHAATGRETKPGDSFLNLNVTMQGQAACVLVRAV